MAYSGSCHCGAVKFSVHGEMPDTAISCNCSHCRRKGFLFAFIPRAAFQLECGEDALCDYRFNKHVIAHLFCKTCGCEPFGLGKGPDGAEMAAINMRCVPDADLDALKIELFDGAKS